jgi:hypothetical protein
MCSLEDLCFNGPKWRQAHLIAKSQANRASWPVNLWARFPLINKNKRNIGLYTNQSLQHLMKSNT